jgi:predicted phosphoadenosine phosphosulfate sulfurtransferase
MDVLTAARERIKNVFNTAPKVYLSFSGGKDSIVLSDIIYKMCLAMLMIFISGLKYRRR